MHGCKVVLVQILEAATLIFQLEVDPAAVVMQRSQRVMRLPDHLERSSSPRAILRKAGAEEAFVLKSDRARQLAERFRLKQGVALALPVAKYRSRAEEVRLGVAMFLSQQAKALLHRATYL
jgi:hypothetical protein